MVALAFVLATTFIWATTGNLIQVFEAQTSVYGQLHSLYTTENEGTFVVSLGLRALHVSFASPQTPILFCTPMEGVSSLVLMDVKVVGKTLYVLTSLDAAVYLWSFHVGGPDGLCHNFRQWSYTPKGKPVSGFFLQFNGDAVVGLVDTKRDFLLTAFTADLTSSRTPVSKWTQVMSLQTVDLVAGDVTGTLSKAIPEYYHDVSRNTVVFLDKTGKLYTIDLNVLKLDETQPFLSLVYAPPITVSNIQTLAVATKLGLAAINLSSKACEKSVVVVFYRFVSPLYYNSATDGLCQAQSPTTDGSSIYFLMGGSSLMKVMDSGASLFYIDADNSTIRDFKFYSVDAVSLFSTSVNGTTTFVHFSPLMKRDFSIPFSYSLLFTWGVVEGSPFSVLFYDKNGQVYGTGFGIVLARQNSRDFVSSKLEAVSPAVTKLGVFMGFNEGDGSGFEVSRALYWDLSDLSLPLPTLPGPPTGIEFIFEDFIVALKRVKNEVSAAFVQPEIRSVSTWVPTDWTLEGGLVVSIAFNEGVKAAKIDAVLQAVVAQIEVVIERECEYRDYLVCDYFTLSVTHMALEARKRAVLEEVTFRVNGSGSLLPSLLLSFVLMVIMLFI